VVPTASRHREGIMLDPHPRQTLDCGSTIYCVLMVELQLTFQNDSFTSSRNIQSGLSCPSTHCKPCYQTYSSQCPPSGRRLTVATACTKNHKSQVLGTDSSLVSRGNPETDPFIHHPFHSTRGLKGSGREWNAWSKASYEHNP
jgi:hypothetical protein